MFYHVELSDKRNEYLYELMKARGLKVMGTAGSDTRCTYIFSPARKLSADDISKLKNNSVVFGGAQPRESLDLIKEKQITYHNFLSDEEFAVKNARLTAEGLLSVLINSSGRSIYDHRILLLGAGRVAKAIARIFTKLGLQFIVCTYDDKEHMFALLYCDHVMHGKELSDNIKDFDMIINTIPAPVLDDIAGKIEKETVIIDAASAPCISPDKITAQEIRYIPAPSLPAKYAPCAAAEIMLEFIVSHI